MKNITALPFLVIIFFLNIADNPAFCQEQESKKERNYGFSLGTQFGFVHGQTFEYVYPDGSTKGELYSELTWDTKPVFYYGLQFDFERIDLMSAPGFFASVSFKAGVPADSGFMEDRDWLSPENAALTHFSHSTNRTNEFYLLDAAAGASIPVKSYFYIKPFLNGAWMHFSFTARDGYYKYPEKEDRLYGEVIRYQQDWFLIAAGFYAGTKILSPFYFGVSFQISPFTYCAATDEHLDESKKMTFHDYTAWGLFLEPAGRVSFSHGRLEFSLETAWRYIGKTTGESYIDKNANPDSHKAGAALSLLDTRFFVKVRF